MTTREKTPCTTFITYFWCSFVQSEVLADNGVEVVSYYDLFHTIKIQLANELNVNLYPTTTLKQDMGT